MHQLRIGLIGCGNISNGHIRNLRGISGVEIAGLAEPSTDRLAALRQAHPALSSVPDFPAAAELLDAVELDGVLIMTPHALHYAETIAALDRGLHVLCEKPLAATPYEARDIVARAHAAQSVVAVNYQRRLDPAYNRLRRAIEAGELGALQTISMLCGQNWRALTKSTWRQTPELSVGGMLFDSGSHVLDMMLWLANQQPQRVSAIVDNRGTPVDINSHATVRFAGGLIGQLVCHGDVPISWIETVLVAGDEGMMRYEYEPQYPWRPGRLFWYRGGEVTQPVLPSLDASIDHAWIDAIREHAPNPAPPEAGVAVAELTAAIYRSAREARVVDL